MSNRGRHKKSTLHLIEQILGKDITSKMKQYQMKYGHSPNLDVFLHNPSAGLYEKGFLWIDTLEGHTYWSMIADKLRNHPLYKKWKNERR